MRSLGRYSSRTRFLMQEKLRQNSASPLLEWSDLEGHSQSADSFNQGTDGVSSDRMASDQMVNLLSLIPWRNGRCATWDVNVVNAIASSYIIRSAQQVASAAEAAALRKGSKYAGLSTSYAYFPLAFENLGPVNSTGREFINDLGHRISDAINDSRESSFLFQRLSTDIQRFILVCLLQSFSPSHVPIFNQPERTVSNF